MHITGRWAEYTYNTHTGACVPFPVAVAEVMGKWGRAAVRAGLWPAAGQPFRGTGGRVRASDPGPVAWRWAPGVQEAKWNLFLGSAGQRGFSSASENNEELGMQFYSGSRDLW